jgi:hypothetical protein
MGGITYTRHVTGYPRSTALAGGFGACAGNFFALAICRRLTVLFSRFSDAMTYYHTSNPHKQLYNEDLAHFFSEKASQHVVIYHTNRKTLSPSILRPPSALHFRNVMTALRYQPPASALSPRHSSCLTPR